jgi:hypothetical protein
LGSLGIGLMAGRGGPVFSLKGPSGGLMLFVLPYTGFAGGAMNG